MYNELKSYANKGISPFHTPGHKGIIDPEILKLDLTELPDTGSLYGHNNIISDAEKQAADYFGAHTTCFSAGGCTLAIQAMIKLAVPQNGKLLIGRCCHQSAIHAMALLGVTPVWIYEGGDLRINSHDVEAALSADSSISAVYVTSPHYYGVISDIRAIADCCKHHGIPLLVDNAHGAHLKEFSLHPLTLGASITACSAHKTLPVLTGGAFLNIADSRYASGAKDAMKLFGSTSPSYMVMASLDRAVAGLLGNCGEYAKLSETVDFLKEKSAEKGLGIFGGAVDPVRLTIDFSAVGLTADEAYAHMRSHMVEPEYTDSRHMIFIASPRNTQLDFERLAKAIDAFPAGAPIDIRHESFIKLPSVMPLRDAVMAPDETIEAELAAGRTVSKTVSLCPPGIPIAVPGEKISADAVILIKSYGIRHINVVK